MGTKLPPSRIIGLINILSNKWKMPPPTIQRLPPELPLRTRTENNHQDHSLTKTAKLCISLTPAPILPLFKPNVPVSTLKTQLTCWISLHLPKIVVLIKVLFLLFTISFSAWFLGLGAVSGLLGFLESGLWSKTLVIAQSYSECLRMVIILLCSAGHFQCFISFNP